MSACLTALLMWRVKHAGRHAPARVLNGETQHVSGVTCLDMARSLYETQGVAGVGLVLQTGEWWMWRAEGPARVAPR